MTPSAPYSPKPSKRVRAWVAAAVAGTAALSLWLGFGLRRTAPPPSVPPDIPASELPADIPREPAASFATFRQVLEDGGDELTREAAVTWLDTLAREGRPPGAAHGTGVFEMFENNGHPSWGEAYRRLIFNSAFNALHRGDYSEPLARVLLRLASDDPDRNMRLYAVQHLGSQRRTGRLTGALAAEVRVNLETFASEPDGEVSGLAIALLADWNGPGGEPDAEVLDLAMATAADRSRAIDVRVSSIHAAGPAALPLLRRLAGDPAEPVILRKAAIARLGRYGGPGDIATLEELRGAGSRLAQAARPALESLRNRLADPSAPVPVPY